MSPSRRLLSYFARHRKTFSLGALCVVGSAVFSLTKPLIVGNAVNVLQKQFEGADLIRYGLLFVGAAAIEGVFLFLQRRIIIGASREMEFDMRNDLYSHLQLLPLRYFQNNRTGDLMSRATNDLSSVRMLIGPAVMHAFSSLLVVTGAFIMMLRIDVPLALLSLISVPLVAGLVKYFGEKIHTRFKSVQEDFGTISARVQENLSGVRVVRAFAQEANEIEHFKELNREYVEKNRSLIKLTATFYPLLHCVIGLLFVLVFFLGSRHLLAGSMTLGSFVAFQFYLGRMVWPLIALGWVINLFQRGMASMKRLADIWDATPATDVPGSREPRDASISIRNLTFAYEDKTVLQNLSLEVPAGSTVGIVGRTGSGKSTILALLARIYDAPPGSILIGGIPVEELSLREVRSRIGMVPQETFLFSDSIAENIRFGRESATTEETAAAARLAGLDEDLREFPEGAETVIGERGITLSGGQKQRTAIARAILRDPSILILDDCLSAVDTHTEERILRSLRDVREGRTAIIVSHRVSSVRDADQVVVIEEGRIVEKGSSDELLKLNGYYANLYRRQMLEEEIEEIA